MRIELVVPYGVEAKPVGTRKMFRSVQVTTTTHVDVAELSTAECPPVASCVVGGRETLFRSVDGAMAVRLARPSPHADDAAWLAASARSWSKDLRIGRSPSYALEGLEDDPRLLVRARDGVRDAAVAKAVRAAQDLVLVDGQLWSRGPGPVVRLTEDRDGLFADTDMPVTTNALSYHQFRLDQVHLIEAYAREVFPSWPVPAVPVFRVHDAGLLGTYDPQAMALAHAALIASHGPHDPDLKRTLRSAGEAEPLDPVLLRGLVAGTQWHDFEGMRLNAEHACLAYDMVERDRTAAYDEASILSF